MVKKNKRNKTLRNLLLKENINFTMVTGIPLHNITMTQTVMSIKPNPISETQPTDVRAPTPPNRCCSNAKPGNWPSKPNQTLQSLHYIITL